MKQERAGQTPPLPGSDGENADGGHVAASEGAFLAITEKKVAAAGSAEIADEYISGVETSVEKLGAVGFAQIE